LDPLSHALSGAALGMVVAPAGHLRTGAVAGAVVALIPDLDVLIRDADDPLLQVEMHRHFSHTLVAGVLLGLAAAWLVAARTATRWRAWLGPLVLAALSAALLDVCTSYGVHLLWPFTAQRISWSIIAVVDPLFTVPVLMLGVVGIWRSSRYAAAGALLFAFVYLAIGFAQHQRVDWAARSLAAERGHQIERLVAKPTIGNLLLWRTLYVANGAVYADAIRAGRMLQVYPGTRASLVSPGDLGLTPGSVLAGDVKRMQRLSQAYLVRHPTRADVYGDARFAMQPDAIEPMFGISVNSDAAHLHAPYVEMRAFGPEALRRFKAMLKGEDLPRLEAPALIPPS
jgi:inner membrane protein